MNTGYQKLFKLMPQHPAPAGLSDSVMRRIEAYEVRRLRLRAFMHGALVLAALILCIPVANSIATAITQTGFGTYLSVAFSDSSYTLSHLKDFMLTLADTLPGAGTIGILAIALIFANSLGRMLGSISTLFAHRRRLVLNV